MEHVARHALGAGPDGDRQQHHVHHAEEPATPSRISKLAPLPVGLGRRQEPRVQLVRLVAQRPRARATSASARDPGIGIHADALLRQVHPGRAHARHAVPDRSRRSRCRPRNALSAATARSARARPARRVRRPRGPPRRRGRPTGGVSRRGSAVMSRQPFTKRSRRCLNSVPSAACGLDLHHPLAAVRASAAPARRRPSRRSPGHWSSFASVGRPTSTVSVVTGAGAPVGIGEGQLQRPRRHGRTSAPAPSPAPSARPFGVEGLAGDVGIRHLQPRKGRDRLVGQQQVHRDDHAEGARR